VNKFFYPKGGAETVFFQERKFLLNTGNMVIDFSMDHPDNQDSPYFPYFVPNVDYNARFKRSRIAVTFIHNREAIKRLRVLIEKERPHIAHLHNIYHQITPAIIPVLSKAGLKIVMTLHDYKIICPNYLMVNRKYAICNKCQGTRFWHATAGKCKNGSYIKSLLLSIEAYWYKWSKSYEKVDIMLCPSRFLADLVAKYRIDPARVRVLPNGIDTDASGYSKEDSGYALFLGRISKEKGVETLLKAHRLLSNRFKLKIVGTGPLMGRLKPNCPDVEFTGNKTGLELKELVRNASFVIAPSECNENCSMSVLSGMAFGKPVIASRIGGIPEQVDDNKTGCLFKMGDSEDLAKKMAFLANNKDLRREMGKAARKKAEEAYSLDAHCRKLIGIYEEILR